MVLWDGEIKDPVTTSGPIGTKIRDLHEEKNRKSFVNVDKKKIKASIPVLNESLLENHYAINASVNYLSEYLSDIHYNRIYLVCAMDGKLVKSIFNFIFSGGC